MSALSTLLQHPMLWRGNLPSRVKAATGTGFIALDKQLHQGGWPVIGSSEILLDQNGIGELSLLLPGLAQLSRERRIGWLSPPCIPYAPALKAAGLNPEHCLLIEASSDRERLWAAEQMLTSGALAAVMTWFARTPTDRDLRRLHLAAQQGHCWHIHFRPSQYARNSSPAPLRMQLRPDNNSLQITLCKQPGGWSGQTLNLPRAEQLTTRQQSGPRWPYYPSRRQRRPTQTRLTNAPAESPLITTAIPPATRMVRHL